MIYNYNILQLIIYVNSDIVNKHPRQGSSIGFHYHDLFLSIDPKRHKAFRDV